MTYDDDARAFSDALARAARATDAEAARAHLAYGAMKASGRLKSYRLIEYRCAAGRCLLLDVVNLPEPVGLVLHQPRFKQSPALNEQMSSASGRAKHTEDGDRRWRARTVPRSAALNVALTCDHVQGLVLDFDRVATDIAARRGRVLLGR